MKPKAQIVICYLLMVLCQVINGQNVGEPFGVAVFKERPGQGDEFAKAFLFTRMQKFTVTTTFHLGAGPPVILENACLPQVITFGDLLYNDVVDDSEKAAVRARVTELSQAAKRFPVAAPSIKSAMDLLNTTMGLLDSGQVRFRGHWMASSAYNDLVKHETELAEAQERQRQAEFQDKMQREKNLQSRRPTLTGRYLLKEHVKYMTEVTSPSSGAPQSSGTNIEFPVSMVGNVLLLPKVRGLDVLITEGKGIDAPAIEFVKDANSVKSFRMAVGLQMENDSILNHEDLRQAKKALQLCLPELAEALPLCLVSARTRLQFQRNKGPSNGEARIKREFSGHTCEITLSEPSIQEDGSLHAILGITVH